MMSRNGSLAKDLTIAADSETDQPFNSIEYISEIYYETPPSKVHVIPPFPDPAAAQPAGVPVVKAEEALIVIFVLVLWVAAIALFFNRWGKIRMLEPYQPKFHQEHRQSCPMVEIGTSVGTHQHRMSFSKYNVNSCIDPPIFAAVPPTYRSSLIRPRQNSVFVGSSTNMLTSVSVNTPARKTKSAIDIQSLILSEARDSQPLSSKSMLLPVTMSAAERRTSCSVLLSATAMVSTPKDRRASCSTTGMLLTPRPADRRPSSSVDHVVRDRQMSYCGDFLLSPQPPHRSDYRRTSSTGDYLSPIGIGASRESRRPSFNNVIAQVTAEQRRPSSSMLRISSNI